MPKDKTKRNARMSLDATKPPVAIAGDAPRALSIMVYANRHAFVCNGTDGDTDRSLMIVAESGEVATAAFSAMHPGAMNVTAVHMPMTLVVVGEE